MRRTSRTPAARRALGALALTGGALLLVGAPAMAGGQPIDPPPPPTPDFEPLTITKTAYPTYTRVNSWDIDKWAAPQAGWDKKDQSVAVDYSVKVTKSWRAERIRVFGTISVTNPNKATAFAYKVGDDLPGGVCQIQPIPDLPVTDLGLLPPAPVPLGVISPDSTLRFAYECTLEKLPKNKIYNTGWVRYAPILVVEPDLALQAEVAPPAPPELPGYAKTEVPVVFADAEYREVFPAVKVIDTLDGDETRLLHEALTYSKTFTYKRYLSFWRLKKICRTWHNTAKITPVLRAEPVPVEVTAQQPDVLPAPPPLEEWAKTDEAWVKICPPPAPVKGEDPAPPKVEVSPGPDDKKSDPVVVKPVDNPKGPVVKDNKSKGRLLVSKWTRTRTAQVGDIVTWNIKVKNIGKAELYGVKVVDLLPKHLVPVTTETENRRGVVFPIGDLAPGDSDVIEVSTRVVGKPVPTPAAINVAKRIKKAKDRDEALRRLRRGLVCNVVTATARKAASDSDIACIRIIKERPVVED